MKVGNSEEQQMKEEKGKELSTQQIPVIITMVNQCNLGV